MWLTLILIVLAVAMMLGPIMLMQPSKRQRRLAELRAEAAKKGLHVRMAPAPAGTEAAGSEIAVYYRFWPHGRMPPDSWLLVRRDFEHGIHFSGHWDWADGNAAVPAWHEPLRQAIAALPTSVVAVESGTPGLGVYWLESTGAAEPLAAVADLATWLDQLMTDAPLVKRRREA